MSTLVEIEEAVISLPSEQQKNLLHWLPSKLAEESLISPGKAGEWLREARGSVRLEAEESGDDVRMNYYATKYGLNP